MLGRKNILSLHSRTANPNLVVVSLEYQMHELRTILKYCYIFVLSKLSFYIWSEGCSINEEDQIATAEPKIYHAPISNQNSS